MKSAVTTKMKRVKRRALRAKLVETPVSLGVNIVASVMFGDGHEYGESRGYARFAEREGGAAYRERHENQQKQKHQGRIKISYHREFHDSLRSWIIGRRLGSDARPV